MFFDHLRLLPVCDGAGSLSQIEASPEEHGGADPGPGSRNWNDFHSDCEEVRNEIMTC